LPGSRQGIAEYRPARKRIGLWRFCELSISVALLIVRVVVGLTVAAHGAQKAFGWWGGPGMTGWTGALKYMRVRPAMPQAIFSAALELVGGVALAVGLLTPLAAFAIIATQLVAVALVHIPKGFWSSKGGYEFNLALLAGVFAVAIAGPGAYSLDRLFGISFPEPVTFIVLAILTVIGVGVTLVTRTPEEATASQTQTT
jgi:putative oxidoreductase